MGIITEAIYVIHKKRNVVIAGFKAFLYFVKKYEKETLTKSKRNTNEMMNLLIFSELTSSNIGGIIFWFVFTAFLGVSNFFLREENKELKKKIDTLNMKPKFQDDTARQQRNVDSIYEKKYLDSQKENRELISIIKNHIENF